MHTPIASQSSVGAGPRILRGLLALLVLTLAVVSAQPTGAAAAPREFYGVVPEGLDLGDAEFDRMQRGKIGVVRLPIFWSNVEATDDSFNWSLYDRLVGGLASRGIRVQPFFYGTPSWLSPEPTEPPRTDRARAEMQEFLTATVDRYGRGGTLWAGNPGAALPITTWQFMNEVNSNKFYAPRPDPREYGKLVKLADRAIAAADPKARVILAGMYGTPKSGSTAWSYLRKLYRVPGVKRSFDGVALHPYAGNKRGIAKQVSKVSKVMKQKRDKRTKIYVTEIGWGSGTGRNPQLKGKKGQARMIKASAGLLRKRFKVKQIMYYALKDPPASFLDPCKWCGTAGLLTGGLAAKPGWVRLTRLAGGKP